MRAVLDTNILVSAALVPLGASHRILEATKSGAFELITSDPLLDELESVLSRRRILRGLGWAASGPSEFIEGIREWGTVVPPQRTITALTADPDDNRVLEAAVDGEANYIVTGERHLLGLKRHEGIMILPPTQFLAILPTEADKE